MTDAGRGVADWWAPYLRIRLKGEVPEGLVGAMFEIAANEKGDLASRRTSHFTGRVREAVEDRRMVLDYVAGDFRGTGEWTLEPSESGGTHLKMRWRADPRGLTRWSVSWFVDVGAAHSEVMQRGFEQLESYLRAPRIEGPASSTPPPRPIRSQGSRLRTPLRDNTPDRSPLGPRAGPAAAAVAPW